MARLDVTGMGDVIRSLAKMDENIGPAADAMLNAAGEVVVHGWQFAAAKRRHIQTGSMYDSIKASKPITKGDVRSIFVTPTGTDKHNRRKAVRNAEKGFVLNYGRNNMEASHWADEADEISEAPAQNAMLNVYDEFLKSGNAPEAGYGSTHTWRSGGEIGTATYHQR